MSHRGANSGSVLTSPLVSFAFFAESFANFAVKDFDLGSRLNKDEILNRKDRKGVPQRTQSPLNYDTTEIPLSARMDKPLELEPLQPRSGARIKPRA